MREVLEELSILQFPLDSTSSSTVIVWNSDHFLHHRVLRIVYQQFPLPAAIVVVVVQLREEQPICNLISTNFNIISCAVEYCGHLIIATECHNDISSCA